MSRIRTVKPELFRHESLFDAETSSGLPLRLAFIGMLTVADCEGRFTWKPRTLKLDVLPHDSVDFSAVLDALERHGFIEGYSVDGVRYGWIPTFKKHQQIPTREADRGSCLPPKPDNSDKNHEARTEHVPVHAEARTEHVPSTYRFMPKHVPEFQEGEGNRKGKGIGREGSVSARARRTRTVQTELPPDFTITPTLQAWADEHGHDRMQEHLEAFRGKALAKGYRYADWEQAFRNAVRDDWAGLRKSAASGGGRLSTRGPSAAPATESGMRFDAILRGMTPEQRAIEGEVVHATH